jgi:hypothetical protein
LLLRTLAVNGLSAGTRTALTLSVVFGSVSVSFARTSRAVGPTSSLKANASSRATGGVPTDVTVKRNEVEAKRLVVSVAVTTTRRVPSAAEGAAPVKVAVAGSKASQLGSAVVSSEALSVRISPLRVSGS